jgi:hypothetical protein
MPTPEPGVATGYDPSNLTITVGSTQSDLQALGVAAADMPVALIEINWG